MATSRSSASGVERLLAQVKPRWTRERHERVFAAILEHIRSDAEMEEERERRQGSSAAGGEQSLGHFEGGHSHA